MNRIRGIVAAVVVVLAGCGAPDELGTGAVTTAASLATSTTAPSESVPEPTSPGTTVAPEQLSPAAPGSTVTTVATDPETPTSAPAEEPTVIDPNATVQKAVADLATRQGVESTDITVVVFEGVTWRDGSLGCPEPGMSYSQALVSGTRTILEIDGRQFFYHSGRDGEPFFCASPADPYTGSGGDI